ncbi:MAG: hypothetical protein ACW990_00005 [Promethearchaeota archaeon]|jgi:hypothetical protein
MSDVIFYCPKESNRLDITEKKSYPFFSKTYYEYYLSCDQCFSKFTYNNQKKEFKGIIND